MDEYLDERNIDCNATCGVCIAPCMYDEICLCWVPLPPFVDPSELQQSHRLLDQIRNNYLWAIAAVGLPGNLAAIFTVTTVLPVTKATSLVALLAGCDSVAIVIKLLVNQLDRHFRENPSEAFCRAFFLTYVCSSYANWVLVLIAAERLVAVLKPLARDSYLSTRRVIALCLLLFLLILSVHAPFIFSQRVGLPDVPSKCYTPDHLKPYGDHVWPWVNMTLYAFLPLALLLVTVTWLAVALKQAQNRREELVESLGSENASTQRMLRTARRSQRSMTLMLLAASLFFMVMIFPMCVFYILVDISHVFDKDLTNIQLCEQILFIMCDSTHALNFYVYFVSVKAFRWRFVRLVRCRKRPCTSDDKFSSRRVSTQSTATGENGNGASPPMIDQDQDAAKMPESHV